MVRQLWILFMFLMLVTPVMALDVFFTDQGSGVTLNGTTVASADLTITLWDAATGGTALFNNTYTGAIVNGSWNVQVNLTNAEFGKQYWKDYAIDGTDLDFDGSERLTWYSSLGLINNQSLVNESTVTGWSTNGTMTTTTQDVNITGEVTVNGGGSNLLTFQGDTFNQIQVLSPTGSAYISIESGSANNGHGFRLYGAAAEEWRIYAGNRHLTFQDIFGSAGTVLFLESGTGRVGINTSSPTQALHVVGSGNFSGNNSRLWVNGSQVCTPANGLCNQSGGSADGTGGWTNSSQNTSTTLNVGIGTSNPQGGLHVNRTNGSWGGIGTVAAFEVPSQSYWSVVFKNAQSGSDDFVALHQQNTGGLVFSSHDDFDLLFVDPINNRIGLGSTTPVSDARTTAGSTNVSKKTFVIRGANGQTAELFQIRPYVGTDRYLTVLSDGKLGVVETAPTAQVEIETMNTTVVPLAIRGVASQAANLTEWKNGTNTTVAYVNASGSLFVESGNRVCTASNGLCSGGSANGTGGWTNGSTQTNTSLNVSINGTLDVAEHMALGSDASIDQILVLWPGVVDVTLNIGENHTNLTAGYTEGIINYHLLSPQADATAQSFFGIDNEIFTHSANSQNIGEIAGIYNDIRHQGSGNVTIMYAMDSFAANTGSGSVDDIYGIRAAAWDANDTTTGIQAWADRGSSTIGNGNTSAGHFYVVNRAPISSGTDNTYALRASVTNRTGATGGTINTYGLHLNIGHIDNAGAGTHNLYGIYLDNVAGADNNWAIYSAGGDIYLNASTTNITGTLYVNDSQVCTQNNGLCNGSGGGGNYTGWLLAASGTSGSTSITNGTTVNLTGGSGVTVTRSGSTIEINASGGSADGTGGWQNTSSLISLVSNSTNVSIGFDGSLLEPNLFVDNKNGRVGINTNTPSYELDVQGLNHRFFSSAGSVYVLIDANSANNGHGLTFMSGGNQEWEFQTINGDLLVKNASNYDVLSFENGSNFIGVGTSDPNSTLHVIGTINATGDICINSTTCLSTVGGSGSKWNITTSGWLINNSGVLDWNYTRGNATYLTSYTESDPLWAANYSGYNKTSWDTAYAWGNHSAAGYLTSYTESDPLWAANLSLVPFLAQNENITGTWAFTQNLTVNGSQVCTPTNGLCNQSGSTDTVWDISTSEWLINNSGILEWNETLANSTYLTSVPYQNSAAGWSNTTTQIWTNLDVNISTGNLTVLGGNVGIGTFSPQTALHVVGVINATSDICINSTTCLSTVGGSGSKWSITGSEWLYNNSGVLAWNETLGNATYLTSVPYQSSAAGWTNSTGMINSTNNVTINDVLSLTPRASAPGAGGLGDLYVDSSNALCFYNSTAWEVIGGNGTCV